MSKLSRDQKRELGAVLIKLKHHDYGMTGREWELAKVLEGKGLTRFNGKRTGPQVMSLQEAMRRQHEMAMSHYELSGAGQEFVHRYTEMQLLAGRYLLPGESPWHESWPWNHVTSAVISGLVSIAVTLTVNRLDRQGPTPLPPPGNAAASTAPLAAEHPPPPPSGAP